MQAAGLLVGATGRSGKGENSERHGVTEVAAAIGAM